MSRSRPNVLVLVLDTARSRNVSCYGHNQVTTPNVDRIAEEGIRFENAVANAPWTLPSHASMFTGQLPFDHGAHARQYQLSTDVPTLSELLADVGYETTIISNNGWLSDSFGVLEGFQNRYELWKLFQTDTEIVEPYREYVKNTSLRQNPGSLFEFVSTVLREGSILKDTVNIAYGALHRDVHHHSGERITRILTDQIGNIDRPFFTVANYLEPHLEYFPPEPFRSSFLPDGVSDEEARDVCQDVYEVQFGAERLTDRELKILQGLYDGEIAHADSFVGDIYDYLDENDYLEETMVVVVGDHGENIGDHDLLGHNSSLHETVVQVPLVIRPPGGASGTVVDRPVQLTDLYRTVLETVGSARVPDGDTQFSYDILDSDLQGRPRVAISQYAGLQLERDRIVADYLDVDIEAYDRTLNAISDTRRKLVTDNTEKRELYDVSSESERLVDIEGKEASAADRLEETLSAYTTELSARSSGPSDVDAAIKNRLKDLGYHK